jgi:hypothetical protein
VTGVVTRFFSGPAAERVLGALWFRAIVSIVILALHLKAAVMMGKERFDVTGFNAAPDTAPVYVNPKHDRDPIQWGRLVVARWDAGHYIGQALRGYSQCPQTSLKGQDLLPYLATCDLSFYPTYPMLGRIASLRGRIPIDYALLGISLVSSFLLLVMWTSRAVTSRIGFGGAYASLILFAGFTTAFALVNVLTEPLFFALTFASFLALSKRWYLAGALFAGAATSIRVSGVASGFAFGVALLFVTFQEPPKTPLAWARRALEVLLCGWGFFALLAYYQVRFGDALIYFHAHSQLFTHDIGMTSDPAPLLRSIDMPLHEGLFIVVMTVFFLIGHRDALRKFPAAEQGYWYPLVIVGMGVSLFGSFGLSFAGMNRYVLMAFPVFFAMGMIMRRRPVLLCVWMAFSLWHYWQSELCIHTGGPGNHTLQVCHQAHWIGRM